MGGEETLQSKKINDSILIPKIGLGMDVSKEASQVPKKPIKKLIFVFLVLFAISVLLVGLVVSQLFTVYQKGLVVKNSVETLLASVNEQNLPKLNENLTLLKKSVADFETAYSDISYLSAVPYAGSFIKDGSHAIAAGKYGIEASEIVTVAVEPYADLVGFTSGSDQAQSGAETTQERVDFIVQSLPDVIAKTSDLGPKVSLAKSEIDQIDASKYPEEFRGIKVREKITKIQEYISLAEDFVVSGRPLLEAAPYLLGSDAERRYLVLFQNDKELRPTGGFITAYSIAKVEDGKFEPVTSNDIYNLEANYKPAIPAPEPIVKYLKGPYVGNKNLRLRDINWSPDYAASMQTFYEQSQRVGIGNIDGIISVDTQLLVNLLDVLGPIGVSGYGDFSTKIIPECNCPQVIYELESFADVEGAIVWSQDEPDKIIFAPPNYENRKKIIGPLMNSVLSNALGQPKEKLPALFESGFKSLLEKHVLFYVLDENAQRGVVEFGIGGTIDEVEGDYLHINDSNLGGRKSNLYVREEVLQEIEIENDGSVTKTLTITYKNPEEYDGWLNSVLPNWVRVYVPKGSELISFDGVEDKKDPYDELGKTVFAGFFELRPEGIAKVTLKYKLPFKVDENYTLFIQKQPGKDAPLYQIMLDGKEEEFFLRKDTEVKLKV